MQIENLSKELSTEEQKDVKGGIAFTSQNVPTNVQSNELLQKFDVGSRGPVSIGNDAYQTNYSDQDTFAPVGSLVDPFHSERK
jgi:hypothetical protein